MSIDHIKKAAHDLTEKILYEATDANGVRVNELFEIIEKQLEQELVLRQTTERLSTLLKETFEMLDGALAPHIDASDVYQWIEKRIALRHRIEEELTEEEEFGAKIWEE